MVDDEDYEWLTQWKWSALVAPNNYYAVRNVRSTGEYIYMHRLIMNNPDADIDHANGNGLDNQRNNIRFCNSSQNQYNSRKAPGLSSRYKGVTWNKILSKWQAQIYSNGKCIYLGLFENEDEAARIRDRKAEELCGAFAYRNFRESENE